MARRRLFVVMTGIPASGKTTLGRTLAVELGLPFIDKDDILEAMYDAFGSASSAERTRLSRASDDVLKAVVAASRGAVVCSFWHQDGMPADSGTPTEWLLDLASADVVEVRCECAPEVAVRRFTERTRHPGHLDGRLDEAALRAAFEQLTEAGPLLGDVALLVDTTGSVDIEALEMSVRAGYR